MTRLPQGPVDWIIAVYLLLGALAGLRRGFLASVLAILTAIVALAAGLFSAGPIVGWLDRTWRLASRAADAIAAYAPLPPGVADQRLTPDTMAQVLRWLDGLPWPAALRDRVDAHIQAQAKGAMAEPGATVGDFVYHLAATAALELIAFVFVYLVVVAILRLVFGALPTSVARLPLVGALDRLTGAALGAATSAITVAVVLTALLSLGALAPFAWEDAIRGSAWARSLVDLVDRVARTAVGGGSG
ncbi:MAG: CvpA family protein [Clostridia bacterium]|nr:CvpA family protein [Clostridia bacterium]